MKLQPRCAIANHLPSTSCLRRDKVQIQIAWEVFAANLFTASKRAGMGKKGKKKKKQNYLPCCLSSFGREKTRLHMLVTLQDTFSEKIHFHFPTHSTKTTESSILQTLIKVSYDCCVLFSRIFHCFVRLSKLQKVKSSLACFGFLSSFSVFAVEFSLNCWAVIWVSLSWLQVPRTKQIGLKVGTLFAWIIKWKDLLMFGHFMSSILATLLWKWNNLCCA